MTVKLPCAVVRDLLPLYAEKMTEEETNRLVGEHLESCADCRQKLAEVDTGISRPIESSKPLLTLKKEIRKRRWFSAVIAALLVFVGLYSFFSHENRMELIPWQYRLIEVEGIETRPYEEVCETSDSSGEAKSEVEVLVLQVDAIANGFQDHIFTEDDGTTTWILTAWSSNHNSRALIKDYSECVLYPVPDRLIYSAGGEQELLWGEPMNGGVETLPRLALAFYVFAAAVSALILGVVWFFLRKRDRSWILRQLFFAPLSYTVAHFLIMGTRTDTFFMERDFISIVLIAAALYALFSLAWQIWLQRKKER